MELASLYTVPVSPVNGLSRLTKVTTSKGHAQPIRFQKFSNRPIPFESNWMADSNSNRISKLHRSLVNSVLILSLIYYGQHFVVMADQAIVPEWPWWHFGVIPWLDIQHFEGSHCCLTTRQNCFLWRSPTSTAVLGQLWCLPRPTQSSIETATTWLEL